MHTDAGFSFATADPDLHLLVDGQRIDPELQDGEALFRFPLPSRDVRLMSRADRPSELGLGEDTRLLGYAVTAMALRTNGLRLYLPIDHMALDDGFHDAEDGAIRWTNGAARLPSELFARLSGMAELEVSGFALPQYRRRDDAAAADAALLDRFESLGDDCEFGLVQRHFNAEPISLMRWVGSDGPRLVAGLHSRFAGLGDPAATELVWRTDPPEYKLRDPRYLGAHTWVAERLADPAAEAQLLADGCARLRLLRRKLLTDIARGRRIFVFKATDAAPGEEGFASVHGALRGVGPAPLLCVRRAENPEDIGRVEAIGDGLYIGQIELFSRETPTHDIWRDLCLTTAQLVDAAEGMQGQGFRPSPQGRSQLASGRSM
jgi:hypothetical protein